MTNHCLSLFRTSLGDFGTSTLSWLADGDDEAQLLAHGNDFDPEEHGQLTSRTVLSGQTKMTVWLPDGGIGNVHAVFVTRLPALRDAPDHTGDLSAHLAAEFLNVTNILLKREGLFGHLPDMPETEGRTRLPWYAADLNRLADIEQALGTPQREVLRLLVARRSALQPTGTPRAQVLALALLDLSGADARNWHRNSTPLT